MENIKITCDSTCDLTQELYKTHEIEVLSLGVALGDELRKDGLDVSAEELFQFVEKTGTLPKTSAVSVGDYLAVFRKYRDEGYQVIHISLSSELSASYQNACIAAQETGNVFVVDSRSLSSGSGHLVLLAKELADSGMSANDIAQTLNEKKALLDVSFVLQTLEYLRKGGRCSGLTAYGANLLKIRPEIEVVSGSMKVGKKYRGTMENSIQTYIRGRLEGKQNIDCKRIFITHSGVPDKVIEDSIALVKELHPFRKVIVTRAGCTISSHCGPACLGVLFFRKADSET